jgi:hypothetical protein
MEGVDYAFNWPTPGGLAQADKRFAVRYVGTPSSGKSLTDVEVVALTGAGVAVVATYETTAGFMLVADGGKAADLARAHARLCGMPDGRPIYFALDVDPAEVDAGEWAAVERFLDDAASVIGRDAVGVYGAFAAIERLVPRFAAWGWQTYAWSGGRWSSKAHLTQYRNGVPLAGGTVDLCASKTADFGQWGLGPGEDDMPDIPEIKQAVREVLNEGAGPGQNTYAGTLRETLKLAQTNYNRLGALAASLAKLGDDDDLDEVALAQLVLTGLSPQAVADALDDSIATEVADLLAARLAG